MRRNHVRMLGLALLVLVVLAGASFQAGAQSAKATYPAMSPLDQYLMPDESSHWLAALLPHPFRTEPKLWFWDGMATGPQ